MVSIFGCFSPEVDSKGKTWGFGEQGVRF